MALMGFHLASAAKQAGKTPCLWKECGKRSIQRNLLITLANGIGKGHNGKRRRLSRRRRHFGRHHAYGQRQTPWQKTCPASWLEFTNVWTKYLTTGKMAKNSLSWQLNFLFLCGRIMVFLCYWRFLTTSASKKNLGGFVLGKGGNIGRKNGCNHVDNVPSKSPSRKSLNDVDSGGCAAAAMEQHLHCGSPEGHFNKCGTSLCQRTMTLSRSKTCDRPGWRNLGQYCWTGTTAMRTSASPQIAPISNFRLPVSNFRALQFSFSGCHCPVSRMQCPGFIFQCNFQFLFSHVYVL